MECKYISGQKHATDTNDPKFNYKVIFRNSKKSKKTLLNPLVYIKYGLVLPEPIKNFKVPSSPRR